MVSYDHIWKKLTSKEKNELFQYLIKICKKQVCSFLILFSEQDLNQTLLMNEYKLISSEERAGYELKYAKSSSLLVRYKNPMRMINLKPFPPVPTDAEIALWTPKAQEAVKKQIAWKEKFTREKIEQICWDAYNNQQHNNVDTAN